MNKDDVAEYKIAEAVEILKNEGYNVTASKLRQYEEQGLPVPQKTDAKYRLYNESDLYDIRQILSLRELGYSLRKIKRYFVLRGGKEKGALVSATL